MEIFYSSKIRKRVDGVRNLATVSSRSRNDMTSKKCTKMAGKRKWMLKFIDQGLIMTYDFLQTIIHWSMK